MSVGEIQSRKSKYTITGCGGWVRLVVSDGRLRQTDYAQRQHSLTQSFTPPLHSN